jgi:hypothetical protein
VVQVCAESECNDEQYRPEQLIQNYGCEDFKNCHRSVSF